MHDHGSNRVRRVNLYLIKPSNYDDEGYVVRYLRGVLPSNTLVCLAALTAEALRRDALAGIRFRTHLIDETVSWVNMRRICRTRKSGTRTIVGLVGVQTNQFPRAADLAKTFLRSGVTVIIGGFHVSGSLAMLPGNPPEIQELLDLGACIVTGEAENHWGRILEDAVWGRLSPLYDLNKEPPDLESAPIPTVDQRVLKRFVMSHGGTMDCGRGCPFNCSFCTIINVQGRKMRFRSPSAIAAAVRENYYRKDVRFYFFTDDNFARNRKWEGIFDALIELREKERIPLQFMMQVDVLSHQIKGFIAKARRAGCNNVFIGMESINQENLKASSKRQNQVEDYRNLVQAYRDEGIATHVGYIVGFPFDTVESVRRDLDRLMNEVQVDMASFFVLTPLPGSRDHLTLFQAGAYMDPDLNNYDSMHETMDFPNFPEKGSLMACYQDAWESFYSPENVRAILKRAPKRTYWNLFQNFLWYKASALIERRHPMMTGLFRLKRRTALRPGMAPLPHLDYALKRMREVRSYALAVFHLLLEMQLLWLETRKRSEVEERVIEELRRLKSRDLVRVKLGELQAAYDRAHDHLPQLHVPGRFRLFFRKWNPFSVPAPFYSSGDVLDFWKRNLQKLGGGRVWEIPFFDLLNRSWLDLRLSLHFACDWMRHARATQALPFGLDEEGSH